MRFEAPVREGPEWKNYEPSAALQHQPDDEEVTTKDHDKESAGALVKHNYEHGVHRPGWRDAWRPGGKAGSEIEAWADYDTQPITEHLNSISIRVIPLPWSGANSGRRCIWMRTRFLSAAK